MTSLITKMFENKDSSTIIDKWGIQISNKPEKHKGYKLDPGNLTMGATPQSEDRVIHNLDFAGSDIGIKLQQHKLFDQVPIEKWGVFYQERDSMAAKTFVAMMEKVLMSHDYSAKPMAMFPIPGSNIELWADEIKDKLLRKGSSKVQVVLLLIPGKHGKSQLYRELKRLTLEEIPVVSQIVLSGTINYRHMNNF